MCKHSVAVVREKFAICGWWNLDKNGGHYALPIAPPCSLLLFFDICDFIILTLNLKMEAALEGCSFYLEKKLLLEITCHAYGLGTEVALASGEVSLRTFFRQTSIKIIANSPSCRHTKTESQRF
jgi:hypothetical protein